MDKMPDMRLKKLPMWAQNHIRKLYADIELNEREKNALFAMPASETQVSLRYFYGATGKDTDDQPLPRNQRVRFRPDPRLEQYVDVRIDDQHKSVVIHGGGSGLGYFVIEPQAGNVIAIKMRDR